MKNNLSFFEGKVVILHYTEADYDDGDNACLIYRVVEGKLDDIYGVLNLPLGACWHNSLFDQTNKALEIILGLGVNEVFAPQFTAQGVDFFGCTLGHQDLSEELNEKGEIECWCEFGDFGSDWGIIDLLKEQNIKVVEIHPETMEIA